MIRQSCRRRAFYNGSRGSSQCGGDQQQIRREMTTCQKVQSHVSCQGRTQVIIALGMFPLFMLFLALWEKKREEMRENTVYELIKEYLCFTLLLTVITQLDGFGLIRGQFTAEDMARSFCWNPKYKKFKMSRLPSQMCFSFYDMSEGP